MTRLNSKIGIHKIRLSSVHSTNNFAAKLVNEGLCEHGSVIMADKQTNGRGQRDAEWQSEEKMNLLTSFVFQFKNIEVLKELEKTNQDLIVMCGHYASWEWVFILDRFVKYDIYGVYKKLSNPYFDKVIKESRSKFNGKLISTKEAIPRIGKNTKSKDLCLYGFASDQTPKLKRAIHWGKFMNVNVPIHTGAEMLAKKYNLAIAFLSVEKIKRGYYEFEYIVVEAEPTKTQLGDITKAHTQVLEDTIKENPAGWLWSHRRWKRERPEGIEIHD